MAARKNNTENVKRWRKKNAEKVRGYWRRYHAQKKGPDQVYLVQESGSRYFKVGISNYPVKRLASLRCGHPRELMLVATCPGGQDREKKIHKALKNFHVRGEWFLIPEESQDILLSMFRSST